MFYSENENAIEFLTGQEKATVTFSRQKYANRVRKLAERFPDEVEIISDDGYLYAHIPVDWIKISPKRQIELTEEQREMRRAKLASYRASLDDEYGWEDEQ